MSLIIFGSYARFQLVLVFDCGYYFFLSWFVSSNIFRLFAPTCCHGRGLNNLRRVNLRVTRCATRPNASSLRTITSVIMWKATRLLQSGTGRRQSIVQAPL